MKTVTLVLKSVGLPLLLLVGAFVLDLRGASPNVEGMVRTESNFRTEAASKQEAEKLLERQATIKELLQIVQDPDLQKEKPKMVQAAMERIGEMRAVEAARLLAK